jgi:ankyrin repeat protein
MQKTHAETGCVNSPLLQDQRRWTPLHYASWHGYLNIVDYFIDLGEDKVSFSLKKIMVIVPKKIECYEKEHFFSFFAKQSSSWMSNH